MYYIVTMVPSHLADMSLCLLAIGASSSPQGPPLTIVGIITLLCSIYWLALARPSIQCPEQFITLNSSFHPYGPSNPKNPSDTHAIL